MAARPGPVKFSFLKWHSDDPRQEAVDKELQRCLTQTHAGWRLHLHNTQPCEDSLRRLLRVVPVAELIIESCDWVTDKVLESIQLPELTYFRLVQCIWLDQWGGESVRVSNTTLRRLIKNLDCRGLSVDLTVLSLDRDLETALSKCKSVDLHIMRPALRDV